MSRKLIALAVGLGALVLAACGGRMGGGSAAPMGGASFMLPPIGSDLAVVATLPKHTIGEELPFEGVGSLKSVKWKATVGGFTQEVRSQTLGFPPGTKITIRNMSSSITHTLDVVKEIKGPPAEFPNVKLSVAAKGGDKFQVGYASGPIKPGKSVTITLVKGGLYLIGCAFHYHQGMHDVISIGKEARPGPQATPPTPSPTNHPTSRSSYNPG
ncbi:MAG: hypothetical protein WCB99_01880 [Candidatus Cybelea sp.]|jgi:plastocyanin